MGLILGFTGVPLVFGSSCFLGCHLPWCNGTCRFAEDALSVSKCVAHGGPDIDTISSSFFTVWRWMPGGWAARGFTQRTPCPPFPKGGGNISPSPDVRDLP